MFSDRPTTFDRPLLHLFACQRRVVLQARAGERREHGGVRHVGCGAARLLDKRERGAGEVAVASGDAEGLVEVLERLVEQDQARGVRLEQLGELRGAGAQQRLILRGHALVGCWTAKAVCELAEERVQLDALRRGIRRAGRDRAAVDDGHAGAR
jgi:hypothetical protein